MGNEISSPEVKEMFIRTDLNSNGRVELHEFRQFLDENFKDLRAFASIILKIYGSKNEMSPKQFEDFCNDTKVTDKNDPNYIGRKLFDYIDVDHSNTITNDELYKIVMELELPHDESKEAVKSFAREMEIYADDSDYNVEFTYEEFIEKCLKILGSIWKDSTRSEECKIE